MAIITNSAEGGVDGTTATTGNTGGASGDAVDTVNLNGGDIEFDLAQSSHGVYSYLVQPASGAITELRWNYTATTSVLLSFYVRIDSAFSIASTVAQVRNASSTAASIQVNTSTMRFRVQDTAGTSLHNSNTILPDTWYRCELRVIRGSSSSDGTIEFAYYLADSATPVQAAYSNLAANAGTTDLTNVRLGRPSAGTTDVTNLWVDSIQVLTGTDTPVLGVPWQAQQITGLTVDRVSDTSVDVGWDHPSDAPAGVSIVIATGVQSNDGNGNAPGSVGYDPTTLATATTVTTGLEDADQPHRVTGLTAGDGTAWVVRTAP